MAPRHLSTTTEPDGERTRARTFRVQHNPWLDDAYESELRMREYVVLFDPVPAQSGVALVGSEAYRVTERRGAHARHSGGGRFTAWLARIADRVHAVEWNS